MARFSSLKYVAAETRHLLRDRFARYLPSQHNTFIHAPKKVTIEDESLLYLLLNLSIDFESDLERARTTYESALPPNSGEPGLEDLIEAGWIRVIWGRISTSFEIAHAARSGTAGTMTALVSLLAKRYEQSYRLTDAARNNEALVGVVQAIDRGELAPRDIGCRDPGWVTARLWDRALADSGDPSVALRLWVDRWNQLGSPSLVPKHAWSDSAATAFCEAAIGILGSDPSLVGWDEMRAWVVKQMVLTSNQPPSTIEGHIPPVPATLVDRALWLESHKFERTVMAMLHDDDDIFGLVRLLLAEVEAEDQAPAPHKIARKVIALAIDRPQLFLNVIFIARRSPILLADLLLDPATSPLACLLVAQWQSSSGAWERELTTRDDQTTKTIAFTDAVAVMGYFLQQGSVSPEEAASLLASMYQNGRPGSGNGEAMLAILRNELAAQSAETLRMMVEALTAAKAELGLGTSAFAAALDIIDVGKLTDDVDPVPLITAYVRSVVAGDHALSAKRVSPGGAASLLKLAMRTPADLRQKFFLPMDIKAPLTAAKASDENPYTVNDDIARSIRVHIRVLTRAAASLMESAPSDLLSALIDTVRAGALWHAEKGRIAAFSPRYESQDTLDHPIAADLGAALAVLTGELRERLLAAVLETDEPMVLAQLLSFAPYAMRARIRQRIIDLTPSEAGGLQSLTEVQARIEALLAAGLGDAAGRFMEAERDLKTWGHVAGREVTRLRTTLQLHLLRSDWTAIASIEPPPHLSPHEQSSAAETITFYKALAALSNPAGDAQAAEQIFAQLHGRHHDVVAYIINLFAARISIILEADRFAQLHGEALLRARRVLREAEEMMLHIRIVSASDSEIFYCNKALLMLALGEPDRVIELLTPLRAIRLRDTIEAYTAVALSRAGRTAEAMATLDHAEQEVGETAVLRDARDHILSGRPFAAPVNISSDNDPVPRIKTAMGDLLQMDHIRQAEVLQPPPEPFDTFVIRHVRSAAASVISLVPMMKALVLDSCEDDLSALIRELLTSRLQFLSWSVLDQSQGGFTAVGNPGERDLLLKKDSTTLAVIEAVVCKQPVSYQDLTRHFQKLFGYSTCNLFFHLTYAYLDNPTSILDHLRKTAEHDVPPGFTYLSLDDIPYTDSRPTGFIARYAVESNEVKVVFLVLNMGQHRQKEAAKIARSSRKNGSK